MDLNISALIGKTLTKIDGIKTGSDVVDFYTQDGETYYLIHRQDCCETVYLEDVNGNPDDLLNTPILLAAEVSDIPEPDIPEEVRNDSYTWTFYRLGTVKGTVVLRWLGTSNGYYSESVDFGKVKKETINA